MPDRDAVRPNKTALKLERRDSIKNLANMITASRIAFALAMLLSPPFSAAFWVFYLCGGLSDVLDGPIARKLNQQSDAGARLDSIADLVFAAALAIVVIRDIHIPMWLWLCALFIALLRGVSYGVGFFKYRAFASLHTYLNKAAGAAIFALPLLYALLGLAASASIVCLVALASAVEELAITTKSKELDRDCKGLFIR